MRRRVAAKHAVLRFEHFRCGDGGAPCTQAGCLRQVSAVLADQTKPDRVVGYYEHHGIVVVAALATNPDARPPAAPYPDWVPALHLDNTFSENDQGSFLILHKASDSSFHGGSRRGGYGHGLAVDVVSVKGKTRLERFAVSEELWKWIDAHEKELGVGRPYRDRDPPHVGPIDGKEYIAKRGLPIVRKAGL
jgi:hypothetical protein